MTETCILPDRSEIREKRKLEVRKFQLFSPMLHIGSEVSTLNPFEYVATNSRVYLPDRDALAESLRAAGNLQEYINRIEQRQEITSLLRNTFGDCWHEKETDDGRAIFPDHRSSKRWTEQKITDLRPMIRNGFGQLYIPGTSIKGAIRTAIAYYLLKYADRFKVPQHNRISSIENQLKNNLGELRQRAKFADDRLFMDELFANFGLTYQNRAASVQDRPNPNPNTDIMRAIHVSDTNPIEEFRKQNTKGQTVIYNQSIVTEVLVTSHFNDDKAKYRASIYAEMVFNLQVPFEISIDQEMLSWFKHRENMQLPFQNIDDLIKICKEFAQEQWNFEHDYWQDIKDNINSKDASGEAINLDYDRIRSLYEKEICPYALRVGWGSGLTGTTVGTLLDDELRAQIRDTCGIKAPNFEAPKSRRTVANKNREIQYVLGWARFMPV
jgi:CRISPR-associated protein Csm5